MIYQWFLNDCYPPGFLTIGGPIRVLPDALALCRGFMDEMTRQGPTEPWLPGFIWYEHRRYRLPGSNDFIDLGEGLDLALFGQRNIPDKAMRIQDGLSYVIALQTWRIRGSVLCAITTDGQDPPQLILR